MTALPGADHAAAVIRGEQKAHDFLTALRVNLSTGEELAAHIEAIRDRGELLGFCRYIQKLLELG